MLDYFFVPLVLWVALCAAISDWRTGKIPNRLLLLGLLFGLEATVALTVWLALGGPGQSGVMSQTGPWGYLGALALGGTLAFLISLLLWWFGVWAAGDAKLFSLLAFLTPHGFYARNYVDAFPPFVLFFNTFFCLMVLLLFELGAKLAVRATRRGSWDSAGAAVRRAWTSIRAKGLSLLRIVGGFVAIFLAIRVSRHFTRGALACVVTLNRTMVYVVLFALFSPLSRLFGRPRVFAGAVVAILLYTIYAFGFATDPELRTALVRIGWMSLSIVFLGWLYEAYSGFTDVRELPVTDLTPGMILSATFARRLRENSTFNNERMGTLGPDGLTPRQVETLQTWHARHDPAGDKALVELATTVPFAPAMLLAVVATILLRGYIVQIG